MNAIRATRIFFPIKLPTGLKGTIDGFSDRAFDQSNRTSWISEERFALRAFIITTFAVPRTLLKAWI